MTVSTTLPPPQGMGRGLTGTPPALGGGSPELSCGQTPVQGSSCCPPQLLPTSQFISASGLTLLLSVLHTCGSSSQTNSKVVGNPAAPPTQPIPTQYHRRGPSHKGLWDEGLHPARHQIPALPEKLCSLSLVDKAR